LSGLSLGRKTAIVIAAGATSIEQAQQNLGNMISAGFLTDALYGKNPQGEDSFYYALKHCEIPLALSNIRKVLKELESGNAKDPALGIGPKGN
jgi:hypothetical protein